MEFGITDRDRAFRQRVREWLTATVDPNWRREVGRDTAKLAAAELEWDRALHQAGWSGIWWPTEYGGLSASPSEKAIFVEECARAGAPEGLAKIGKRLIGPIIMEHGTKEQKNRFLPPILSAEELWCQGFSEPHAGSDLAGLTTRAEVSDEGFLINGHKIWTSHAMTADWIFVLARTQPGSTRTEGISIILVPMSNPGITVSPIKQITEYAEFNEVHFDNVAVPRESLLGPLHGGWRAAMSILAKERGAESSMTRYMHARSGLLAYARQVQQRFDGEGAHREKLGRMTARVFTIQPNSYRLLANELTGGAPGHMSSLVKLYATEVWREAGSQQVSDLSLVEAATGSFEAMSEYLNSRHHTISSGSSEIQRNIIAKRVLGLPSSR